MREKRKSLTCLAACATVVLLPGAYLLARMYDSVVTARDRALSLNCKRNLQRVAEAVGVYRSEYGALPGSLKVLCEAVPAVEFDCFCLRRRSGGGSRKAQYAWTPSDMAVCEDAEPHVICPRVLFWRERREVNVLTEDGQVTVRVD